MAFSSSSSSDLLDECMHGGFDLEGYMVEDLDAPSQGAAEHGADSASAGGRNPTQQPSQPPLLPARHSLDSRSSQQSGGHRPAPRAGDERPDLQKALKAITSRIGPSAPQPEPPSQQQEAQQEQQHPFSMQLQLLTSQLQAAQAAAGRAPRVSAGGATNATASSQPNSNSAQLARFSIMQLDSMTGMVVGTGEPGSQPSVASPTHAGSSNPSNVLSTSKPQPSAFAMAANALPAGLTPEQYQTLLDAGVDTASLLSVFQPKPTPAPQPAPTAAASLDQAESLWQQVAATGADDQTLLSVAASLGLITTDALTGSVVLTRDLQQQAQAVALQQPLLQQPGSGLLPVQGLYSCSILDQQQQAAVQSGSLSAPLPRLQQNAALAALLSGAAFGAVRTSGAPSARGLGSPGPGPSKQHTLYKTELCRGWLETGTCRYGSKCQFAHGPEELRPVPRHPKYKTEVCRSFTATGMCAYGNRCRFIHGSVSAPSNAILGEGMMSGMPPNRVSDGLEGVLTLDDLSPTHRNSSLDAGARAGALSPRSRMLLALSRGQASSGGGSTDAAALARLGRLISVPDAMMTGSNRASLESVMSCRMELSAATMGARGRSSMGDTQRSSLDSRAGGRTSLESAQSAQDWGTRMDMTGAMDAPSPQKPSPPVGTDMYGLTGVQRFMPGIPEGRAMTSLPQEEAWLGGSQPAGFPQVGGIAPSGPSAAAAQAAAQLVGQLQGLSFPGNQPQAMQQARQALGLGARIAPGGNWLATSMVPAGRWSESAAGPQPSNDQNDMQKALLSAYSSGLYASSAPASGSHAVSNSAGPSKPTPRRQSPAFDSQDASLAALLGL